MSVKVSTCGSNYYPYLNQIDAIIFSMSLPALFLMTPMALVVIFKHSNLYFAKDSDTCNFNYECSISWGPVKAFNNMLSASSIIIAAIINIRLSFYFKRQRRFFPLNSCVLLTGVLWTLMNYCPQKDSFHLCKFFCEAMCFIETTLSRYYCNDNDCFGSKIRSIRNSK